jgi:hypothetical protein
MNLSDALPADELLLAQLAAGKLAKVMHGLMSVGIASLETDDPAGFLAGRERTPLGFLEVLRCIGVKPGHAEKVEPLRQQVRELIELASNTHGALVELAHWRTMSRSEIQKAVDRAGDGYAQWCQRLGQFCAQLGMEVDYSAQAEQNRVQLTATFPPTLVGRL